MIFANRHLLLSVCLLAAVGFCEDIKVGASGLSDDGSCHIPSLFLCENVTWSNCTRGEGEGHCINKKSFEPCDVFVMPKGIDFVDFRCLDDSCGVISCPSNCALPTNWICDCSATWGASFSANQTHNITDDIPTECLSTHRLDDGSCHIPSSIQCNDIFWSQCKAGTGIGQCINEKSHEPCSIRSGEYCSISCPVNFDISNYDCNAAWNCSDMAGKVDIHPDHCFSLTAPNTLKHSPAFLVVVTGVPLCVMALGIAGIATLTLIYKYRRAGYEAID